jgi:hypothetical protein
MASRKRGTGQSLLQREKMAVVLYCKELETEKPSMSMKEICEKAAHIFDVTLYLFPIFEILFHNPFPYRFTQPLLLK